MLKAVITHFRNSLLEAPSSVKISALALLAYYETASAATAISVTAAMHDHVFIAPNGTRLIGLGYS
jgi:hypothetical protein